MIPKTINHIWLQGNMPNKYVKNYEAWQKLHPTWEHVTWDETKLLKLCKPTQTKTYQGLNTLINKINFLKYVLMYNVGGVYVDLDTVPIKSLDVFLNQHKINDIDLLSTLSLRYPFNTEMPIKKFDSYKITLPARASLMYYPNGDKALLLDNPFLISEQGNEFWTNLINFCGKRTNYKEGFGSVLPHEPYGPYGMTDFLYTNYKTPFKENILIIPPIYWEEVKTISTNKYIIHMADKGW
jgi:hypothetical protein